MEQLDILLENIKYAEGGKLHRNEKESDITTGYGIYRKAHPNASIWNYVDDVAVMAGLDIDSSVWSDEMISEVGALMNPSTEYDLTIEFYKEYFRGAHLELFDSSLTILVTNLYTNSPKGFWMSVQEALIDIEKDGILPIDPNMLSSVDGDFGDKTRNALEILNSTPDYKDILLFKKSILLAMKSFYIDLSVANPNKYLPNLNGWDNRMDDVEHAQEKM